MPLPIAPPLPEGASFGLDNPEESAAEPEAFSLL